MLKGARKKLESRRLAYDTSLAKMQKAKKEDFRVEEELRSQKAKYEETSEDVYRRMQDVSKDNDSHSGSWLTDLFRSKRRKRTALQISRLSSTQSSSIMNVAEISC